MYRIPAVDPGLVHRPGPHADGRKPVAADSARGQRTDNFSYLWKTDPGSIGCGELIVKLVDVSR